MRLASRSCVLGKLGWKCKPDICHCPADPACYNPFNLLDLPSIFGSAPVTLHECFITWVLKPKIIPTEQITTRFLCDLALQYSQHIKNITDYNDPYLEWRAKWDALPKTGQDSAVELQQEMNRMAFTKHDLPMSVFFSFCRGNERCASDDKTSRCIFCGTCRGWREWHCGLCDECNDEFSLPCNGCGGVSIAYNEFAKLTERLNGEI